MAQDAIRETLAKQNVIMRDALKLIAENAQQMADANGGHGGMWQVCADEARAAIAKATQS